MTVLFKGIIVTLVGSFITPGTKAPDFSLVKNEPTNVTIIPLNNTVIMIRF